MILFHISDHQINYEKEDRLECNRMCNVYASFLMEHWDWSVWAIDSCSWDWQLNLLIEDCEYHLIRLIKLQGMRSNGWELIHGPSELLVGNWDNVEVVAGFMVLWVSLAVQFRAQLSLGPSTIKRIVMFPWNADETEYKSTHSLTGWMRSK